MQTTLRPVWSPPELLLEATSGDDDLIADLIDSFKTDTVARICQIRVALAYFDFPKICAQAHTIKGSARQMGADAVADACRDLETAAGLQQATLVAAQVDLTQELFEEAHHAMTTYSTAFDMRPQ